MIRDIDTHRIIMAAEANRLTLAPIMVDAQEVLRDAKLEYSQYEAVDICTLWWNPTRRPCASRADRSLVDRVIGNMLKNALEASTVGDTITLRALPDPHGVTFEVHNPLPMPRKVQLQVFQRSYSTKGAGRGLGTYGIKLLERELSSRQGMV